ncbi:hypothetical protein ABIE56_003155 [Luteibacter sp. 621]|jgi:hypothetical protein
MEPLFSTLASCISILSALLGLVEKSRRVLGRKRNRRTGEIAVKAHDG